MKLAGRLLLGLCVIAACGDDKSAKNDAAAVRDAHVDAPADAFAGACMASSQCSNAAEPLCCWFFSPGGAGATQCEPAPAGTGCDDIACRGSGDPCLTKTGSAGTCTSVPMGPTQMPYWVCR